MRAEHLKRWLKEATREEEPEVENWNNLVERVRHIWETGELPTALPWSVLVLIPKGGGDFRGIGLLEIVWKLMSKIIDRRIKHTVHWNDSLHGFRKKRGTGTAILEAKLHQQKAVLKQQPFFEIFLDLKKAYDALDRGRTISILRAYGC